MTCNNSNNFKLFKPLKLGYIWAGRTKAIRQLSRSVIESYWDIGRRILESQQQHGWGKGILIIMSKSKPTRNASAISKPTAKMEWSRDVLLNQIKTGAYECHLLPPEQTNFDLTSLERKPLIVNAR